MPQPISPEPNQFGLTKREVEVYRSDAPGIPCLELGIFVLEVGGLITFLSNRQSTTPLFQGTSGNGVLTVIFLVALFFGWVAVKVGQFINAPIKASRKRQREREPAFQNYLRFVEAARQYERDVRDAKEVTAAQRREHERQAFEHLARWKELDGWEFERRLAELLRERGWKARATKGSGDEGVDIVLRANDKVVLVQCKNHAKTIGPSPVRDLYGTLHHHKATEAWLITTADFSAKAMEFARGKPLRLMTMREILSDRTCARPS